MANNIAFGTVTRTPLAKKEIIDVLKNCKKASVPGKTHDGTRIHVEYHRISGRKITIQQKNEAQRAKDLELSMQRYTGRLDDVKVTASGDTIVVLFVELERDHKYRSFNIDKGQIHKLAILGD